MKLKKLVIHKFRNVKPGTVLEFSPGKNVLLGRNGTGKTTLLDLIATVASSNFEAFKSEEFVVEYSIEASECSVHATVRNERSKNPLDLDPATLERTPMDAALQWAQGVTPLHHSWTCHITVTDPDWSFQTDVTPSSCKTVVTIGAQKHLIPTDGRSFLSENVVISSFISGWKILKHYQEAPFVFSKILSALSIQFRFDEALGAFRYMLTSQLTFKRPNASQPWISLDLGLPTEIKTKTQEHLSNDTDPTTVQLPSDTLGFLNGAAQQLGFASGRFKAERIEKTVKDDGEQLRFGNFSFEFVRADGSAINHSLLSFGQKRMLAFYYYLACFGHTVVADELVNGLHHQWIENCLDEMGDRQAFLTSQNPLLLDYLHFESAEQARESFILCRTEIHDNHERLAWSNMSEEDAQRFFNAYQVDIQSVSEILRTKGLW